MSAVIGNELAHVVAILFYQQMDIIEESHVAAGTSSPPNSDLSVDSKKRTSEEAHLDHLDDPESDRMKLQARREANRVHAFKSRQRNKVLLTELQVTVNELAKEKSELERHNAVLRAQVEVLQQQNFSLLQNQQQMMLHQKGSSQLPQSLAGHGFNFASNPFMAAAAAAAAASGMGASSFGNNASLAMLATMMAASNPGPNAAAVAMMNSLASGQAPTGRGNAPGQSSSSSTTPAFTEEANTEHSAAPQSAPPAVHHPDLTSLRGAESGAGNSIL